MLLPRLEHLYLKLDSILSSAGDAENVFTQEMRNTIKESLQKSFEKKDHVKTMSGIIASPILIGICAILPDDWSRDLGEVNNKISRERRIDRDDLKQKFDRTISKIDCMSGIQLRQIMRVLKKYDLEGILDYINVGCAVVLPIKKQNKNFKPI
ncbi:MAG: hypothetical protein KGI19_07140 [Thaumarchaeota archaeon]|nr:hypothetical protein [Nitrososphaerota archaeon]